MWRRQSHLLRSGKTPEHLGCGDRVMSPGAVGKLLGEKQPDTTAQPVARLQTKRHSQPLLAADGDVSAQDVLRLAFWFSPG